MRALMPRKPFRRKGSMNRLFDLMVDRMFPERRWLRKFAERTGACTPVEYFMQNSNLVVRADVPGTEPKDIDISLLGNVLTIKGERKSKEQVKKGDYLRREIAYGAFERHLTLPDGAQTEKVKAEFKNGVVEITVPLTKRLAVKKIPLVEAK